jgi:pimeloyl-ACP methyl ester carboxylesterase
MEYGDMTTIDPAVLRDYEDNLFKFEQAPTTRPPEASSLPNVRKHVLSDPSGASVVAYESGEGAPVLLMHGAFGSRSQFDAIATALNAAGMCTITFDLPGHGDKSNDSLGIISAAPLLAILDKHYAKFRAIVAHSFGSLPAFYALAHEYVHCEKLVSIGTPDHQEYLWHLVFEMKKIPPAYRTAIIERYREQGATGDMMRERSPIGLINKLSCAMLLIHDKNDRMIPFSQLDSLCAAAPHAQRLATEGLGHARLLADPAVTAKIVEFIAEP